MPSTPNPQADAHPADPGIEVGDKVNVPGDMYGTVRFVGSVKGKAGTFAGVELSREFAQRGKNDGAVDGRAVRRPLDPPTDAYPQSPRIDINSAETSVVRPAQTPPTPSLSKFNQSITAARAASPMFKPRSRPSLPRPESPSRRQPNLATTPAGRPSVGAPTTSRPGGSRYAPSPTPGKLASTLRPKRHSSTYAGDPGRKALATARPHSRAQAGGRSESALGDRLSREAVPTMGGLRRLSHDSYGSGTGPKPSAAPSHADDETTDLRYQLEQRERQLKEQAASLAEMETSLAELQSLVTVHRSDAGRGMPAVAPDDADAPQLRALLREKNEKITMLTAKFDAHRADFRSTIDTLELASTETERVYEQREKQLLNEIRELEERGKDVNLVARQLKQLEELVQELEEGLEDARRGEAEARSEVEFLRGEVERGRLELRREREKAAAALKGAGAAANGNAGPGGAKEVERRDDEIRGLKAIIHSLSRDSMPEPGPIKHGSNSPLQRNGEAAEHPDDRLSQQLIEEQAARDRLEREMQALRGLVEKKVHREGELEREIDRLRDTRSKPERQSVSSEMTVTVPKPMSDDDHDDTGTSDWRNSATSRPGQLETMHESDTYSSDADGSALWCEICETGGHDILTCTNMFDHQQRQQAATTSVDPSSLSSSSSPAQQRTGRDVVVQGLKGLSTAPRSDAGISASKVSPQPKSLLVPDHPPASSATATAIPAPNDSGMVAGKASGVIDAGKWCALCERDGHESVDCPFEEGL